MSEDKSGTNSRPLSGQAILPPAELLFNIQKCKTEESEDEVEKAFADDNSEQASQSSTSVAEEQQSLPLVDAQGDAEILDEEINRRVTIALENLRKERQPKLRAHVAAKAKILAARQALL